MWGLWCSSSVLFPFWASVGWGQEVVGLVGCSCPFLVGKPHISVNSSPFCWVACCYGLLRVCAAPEHSGIKHWWYRILANAWRRFHLWALSSSAVLLPKPHGSLPALLLILSSHNSLWNRLAHSSSIFSPQMDVEVKTMKFFTGIDFSYIFWLSPFSSGKPRFDENQRAFAPRDIHLIAVQVLPCRKLL